MTALAVAGLVKRFGATTALDGVSLELAPGEVRGLLGPNGAGKTTLLRVLFGLIVPDAGTAQALGHGITAGAAINGLGGFVEEPAFYPYLSARINLAMLARLDDDPASAQVDAALAQVGLADRAEDRVGGYSTGMRQRLGIAAALLRSPRLLLLDEPTSGLDPDGSRAVAQLIRQLSADGVAILLSSHQIGELERVCDSYTFLHRGQVVWDGTVERLASEAPASEYHLVTGDDRRALTLAGGRPQLIARTASRGGIEIAAQPEALDDLVFALADARIAVRRLEQLVGPLEAMFHTLTRVGGDGLEPPTSCL